MKKTIFIILAVFSFSLYAQEKKGITPWDVANLKYVTGAVINTSGSLVLYSETQPVDPTKENATSGRKLFLYNVGNNSTVPFITSGMIRAYKFRPGHNTVTFLSKRDKDKTTSLYEISLEGGEAQKLFEYETSIRYYNWSPDGKILAFIANQEKAEYSTPYQPEIYEENLPVARAYIVDMESNDIKEVPIEGNFYTIKFSPDGKKLASSITPTSLIDQHYMNQIIHIYNAGSFSEITTIDHRGKLADFFWNPNSTEIAFLAGADINDPTAGRLFVSNINNPNPTPIMPAFKGQFNQIQYTGKGKLYALVHEGVYTSLAMVDLKSKTLSKLIDKPDLSLTSFSMADNGFTAIIANSATFPFEFYMMKGKNIERMTNTNAFLEDKLFGKQEVIKYKAKDGLEIEGILIHPISEESGKKYPLIVVVHGGPESHFTNGWNTYYSRVGQMGAAKGYAVLYQNYRGSTGYGEEFAKSSQGDPAGLEFEDIIDGIDYLIERGLVDKDRVGVTGGSYGGYATAWFSTKYSDRFAAGVMFVGISNTISGWGNSDIPTEHYYVHYRKHIWEDYDFFWDRSPVKYVDNAKTPILICAGKNDTRVFPGQSMELYRHIKTRTQTPVRLVFYPGEGHGNRNSTARYDYNLRQLRWFDTFLMQKGTEMPDNQLEELK